MKDGTDMLEVRAKSFYIKTCLTYSFVSLSNNSSQIPKERHCFSAATCGAISWVAVNHYERISFHRLSRALNKGVAYIGMRLYLQIGTLNLCNVYKHMYFRLNI